MSRRPKRNGPFYEECQTVCSIEGTSRCSPLSMHVLFYKGDEVSRSFSSSLHLQLSNREPVSRNTGSAWRSESLPSRPKQRAIGRERGRERRREGGRAGGRKENEKIREMRCQREDCSCRTCDTRLNANYIPVELDLKAGVKAGGSLFKQVEATAQSGAKGGGREDVKYGIWPL